MDTSAIKPIKNDTKQGNRTPMVDHADHKRQGPPADANGSKSRDVQYQERDPRRPTYGEGI